MAGSYDDKGESCVKQFSRFNGACLRGAMIRVSLTETQMNLRSEKTLTM